MKKKHGHSATAKGAEGTADWQKLRALPDHNVVLTGEAPVTSPEEWANAIAHKGLPAPLRKAQIALRVYDDVLAWFNVQGSGFQTRINAVLRGFRDAHIWEGEAHA